MGFLAYFSFQPNVALRVKSRKTTATGCHRWPCSESYECSGDSLVSPGLYLDLPEWGYGVFKLIRKGERV